MSPTASSTRGAISRPCLAAACVSPPRTQPCSPSQCHQCQSLRTQRWQSSGPARVTRCSEKYLRTCPPPLPPPPPMPPCLAPVCQAPPAPVSRHRSSPQRPHTEGGPGVFRYGSREYAFPERGSIAMVGAAEAARGRSHGHGRSAHRREKLEYQLWRETELRNAAERTLRTVVVHGRSAPPWFGEYPERPMVRLAMHTAGMCTRACMQACIRACIRAYIRAYVPGMRTNGLSVPLAWQFR